MESFYTLEEARVLIEDWRPEYSTFRPHGSLGIWLPALETFVGAGGDVLGYF